MFFFAITILISTPSWEKNAKTSVHLFVSSETSAWKYCRTLSFQKEEECFSWLLLFIRMPFHIKTEWIFICFYCPVCLTGGSNSYSCRVIVMAEHQQEEIHYTDFWESFVLALKLMERGQKDDAADIKSGRLCHFGSCAVRSLATAESFFYKVLLKWLTTGR